MNADVIKCGGIWRAFQLLRDICELVAACSMKSLLLGLNVPISRQVLRLFEHRKNYCYSFLTSRF